jgi:hypothetical protein
MFATILRKKLNQKIHNFEMNFYYSITLMYILLIVPKYGLKMHDYFYFADSNIGYFNFISNKLKNNHISHILF